MISTFIQRSFKCLDNKHNIIKRVMLCQQQSIIYSISRQKVLLKKRKRSSKKNQIAKKTLKQKDPKLSYTHQLKILQIQKELDRRTSRNHHINELMDELFYPDVRYANQKAMQQNFLKIAASSDLGKQKDSKMQKGHGQTIQEAIQENSYQQMQPAYKTDALIGQIHLCQIPSQLFEFYLQNSDRFVRTDQVLAVINRLGSYFRNRNQIKSRILKKWAQSVDRLKLTDAQKKHKKKRCPLIFLQKDQILRDQQWSSVVRDICDKILKTFRNGQEITKNGNDQFHSIASNIYLAEKIYESVGYLPGNLYELLIEKTLYLIRQDATIDQMLSQIKESDLTSPSSKDKPLMVIPMHSLFTLDQKRKILKLFILKRHTKSSITKAVHIHNPEYSISQQNLVVLIGRSLALELLKQKECNFYDLNIIMKTSRSFYSRIINAEILELAKPKIIQFLSQNTLETSIQYLYCIWMNGHCTDVELIQLLKYDIYRKLPQSVALSKLIQLLFMMKESCRIKMVQSGLSVPMADLYPRAVETFVGKYLLTGDQSKGTEVSHSTLMSFVQAVYRNFPLIKSDSEEFRSILEMISTSVIKMGQGFKLEELSQLLFRINLLGHQSLVLARYVFDRFTQKNQYHKQLEQYKQTKTLFIEDKVEGMPKSVKNQQNLPSLSLKQVRLQESLIMMIWSLLISHNRLKSKDPTFKVKLPLDAILDLYPTHLQSSDPMIVALAERLDDELEQYRMFPKLVSQQVSSFRKRNSAIKNTNRRNVISLTPHPTLSTNRKQQYSYDLSPQVAQQILEFLEQATNDIKQVNQQLLFSDNFYELVYYLMQYCICQKMQQESVFQSKQAKKMKYMPRLHKITDKLTGNQKEIELMVSRSDHANLYIIMNKQLKINTNISAEYITEAYPKLTKYQFIQSIFKEMSKDESFGDHHQKNLASKFMNILRKCKIDEQKQPQNNNKQKSLFELRIEAIRLSKGTRSKDRQPQHQSNIYKQSISNKVKQNKLYEVL